MLYKIVKTGLLLSAMLLIPGALKDALDPPDWVKAAIIITGATGVVVAFVGTLLAIWM